LTVAEVEARLSEALDSALPGVDVQVMLAPRPRPGWRAGHFPESARAAAVLVLIFPDADGRARLVLTRRAQFLTKHAGQISLPGGAVDRDETIEQASLREAHEEIGLDPAQVRVLGMLTKLHLPVSSYTLYPVVATCRTKPDLQPASEEVERILEVPVDDLLDAGLLQETRMLRDGIEYEVPHFLLCGEQVWGATAMVLAELRWCLEPGTADRGPGTGDQRPGTGDPE
jgi:8-oxo-dGTP pyrophosphatase MutT (NUDIX family)